MNISPAAFEAIPRRLQSDRSASLRFQPRTASSLLLSFGPSRQHHPSLMGKMKTHGLLLQQSIQNLHLSTISASLRPINRLQRASPAPSPEQVLLFDGRRLNHQRLRCHFKNLLKIDFYFFFFYVERAIYILRHLHFWKSLWSEGQNTQWLKIKFKTTQIHSAFIVHRNRSHSHTATDNLECSTNLACTLCILLWHSGKSVSAADQEARHTLLPSLAPFSKKLKHTGSTKKHSEMPQMTAIHWQDFSSFFYF